MDRVGGWYKRWTQSALLGIAILLVLIGNVGTFMLIKRFSRDNVLRASIIAAADQAVQLNPTVDNSAREQLLADADKLTLPIGWTTVDRPYKDEQISNCSNASDCFLNWGSKLMGLLISILAIQLGAPFWFDVLSKFVNIRSAGMPPGESAKSGTQTAKISAVEVSTT